MANHCHAILQLMKLKLLFEAVLVASPLFVSAQNKQTPNLDKVTIFSDGAQVERSMSLNVASGERTLSFEGFSPYLDINSVQVKAKGALTVLGVSHHYIQSDSAQLAQKRQNATQQWKQATRKVEELKVQSAALTAQLDMVKTNASTTNRTAVTPLENIKQLNTYYYNELVSINKKQLELKDQIDVAQEAEKRTKKTLDSLNSIQPKRMAVLDVKVDAPAATRASFSFAYYVHRASWQPAYDLRADNTSSPMHLTYKANIRQQTNEDWKNVKVSLSSANPNRSNTAPVLEPYWLNYVQPKVQNRGGYGKVYKSAAVNLSRAMVADGVVEDDIEIEEANSFDLQVSTSDAKFGYEFVIEHPLTIPSDNRQTTTTIGQFEIPATYAYQSSPKMDKDAFLMAYATDWTDLNLLDGEASIFFENNFVGKTAIDPTIQSDTLKVSLGRDNGIHIERKLQKDNSSRKVLSNTLTQTKDWQINIKNSRKETVTLKVYDQIPVSAQSDIVVTATNLSGGELKKETGIVTWTLTLQPGEAKELHLCYQVKYPKQKTLYIE